MSNRLAAVSLIRLPGRQIVENSDSIAKASEIGSTCNRHDSGNKHFVKIVIRQNCNSSKL